MQSAVNSITIFYVYEMHKISGGNCEHFLYRKQHMLIKPFFLHVYATLAMYNIFLMKVKYTKSYRIINLSLLCSSSFIKINLVL